MGKRNPVKSHQCTDLNEDFKQCQQENAIVGEVQQQEEGWEKKKKMKTTRRAKRRRCMYLLENADASQKSPQTESQDDSLKPSSTGCDQASDPSSALKNFNDKDQNRDGLNTKKMDRHLDIVEVETRHQSSFTSCFLANEDVVEIVLVDVQLAVNASPRAENASFVSLTSEAYGIAVIGYPLDVGEIRGESVACKRRFDQLVWRTSKRSPVCYVMASKQAGKNVKDAMLRNEKSLMKLLKNSKQGKKASNKSCIPVQLIFSKILAAVD